MEDLRVEVGCRALAETKDGGSKIGIARFVGSTYFAPGTWVGVELETADGKNDGTVQNRRYFTCPPRHGIFIKLEQCKALSRPVQTIPQTPRLRRAEEEGRSEVATSSETAATAPTTTADTADTTATATATSTTPSSTATSETPKKSEETIVAAKPQVESPQKAAAKPTVKPTAKPSASSPVKRPTASKSEARTSTPPPAISVAPAADIKPAKQAAVPQSPPKPVMPTLQLNKVTGLPPTGNMSSTLSTTSGSMSSTPLTPRIAGDDLRILLEQKKNLEIKLKEKADLLAAEKEKVVKTKDELKAKYDSQRKADAETMRDLKEAIQQKEEQLSEKSLDLEIAEEEKLMLQERLESLQKGVRESSILKEIATDEEGKEQQLLELSNAMAQMDIIVGDLTQERDMLKEECLALRHLRDKCRVLQNKVCLLFTFTGRALVEHN